MKYKYVFKGLPCAVCGKPTGGELRMHSPNPPKVTHGACLKRAVDAARKGVKR